MRKPILVALAATAIAAPVVASQVATAGELPQAVRDVVSASPFAHASSTPAATATTSVPTTTASKTSPRQYLLTLGSTGARVTELQRRLAGAGVFTHQATGYYGEATKAAVSAFQTNKGLPATGSVDQATWSAVQQLPLPAAPAATASPTATSATSSTGSTTPAAKAPANLDPRCLTGHVMCVDKTVQRLYWVVDGHVVDSFSTRTGRAGMDTREGQFSVYRMEKNSWSNLYKVYMPYAMYFDGGEAVHYSKDFATNGYGVGSHGCVNLRDHSGIEWLYSQVQMGDAVVVYRS